jgi:hypothetical protein
MMKYCQIFLITVLFISCGQNTPKEIAVTHPVMSDTLLPLSDSMAQIHYFERLTEPELVSKAFWDTINVYHENYNFGIAFHNSKAFQYLLAHRRDYEKLHTPDSVQRIICRALEFTLKEASKNSTKFEEIKKEVALNTGAEATRIVQHIEMANYYDKKDFINYARVASEYLDKYCWEDEWKLNWSANEFYKHIDNKEHLQKALSWSKRSLELSDTYDHLNTYSHLLFKLGRMKEARAAAEKAVEKARQSNEDYSSSTELLKEIETRPLK